MNLSVNDKNELESKENIANNQLKSLADLRPKLILNSEPPYLPSISLIRNPRKYTLVLDLDETLVHFVEENDSAFIQIRPGAETFLDELRKL